MAKRDAAHKKHSTSMLENLITKKLATFFQGRPSGDYHIVYENVNPTTIAAIK